MMIRNGRKIGHGGLDLGPADEEKMHSGQHTTVTAIIIILAYGHENGRQRMLSQGQQILLDQARAHLAQRADEIHQHAIKHNHLPT